MINRNKKGQFKTAWYNYKQYDFKKAFLLAMIIVVPVVSAGVWIQLRFNQTVNDAYAMQDSVRKDAWEIGYMQGQIDTDQNQHEDFFTNLSANPQVSFLFKKYFPEETIAKTMRAISLSESKGKQVQYFKLNKNGSWDCGFFQTNTIHRNATETKETFCDRMNNNLEENFKLARKIYDERKKTVGDGFTAWSDYNNGKYLTYIK